MRYSTLFRLIFAFAFLGLPEGQAQPERAYDATSPSRLWSSQNLSSLFPTEDSDEVIFSMHVWNGHTGHGSYYGQTLNLHRGNKTYRQTPLHHDRTFVSWADALEQQSPHLFSRLWLHYYHWTRFEMVDLESDEHLLHELEAPFAPLSTNMLTDGEEVLFLATYNGGSRVWGYVNEFDRDSLLLLRVQLSDGSIDTLQVFRNAMQREGLDFPNKVEAYRGQFRLDSNRREMEFVSMDTLYRYAWGQYEALAVVPLENPADSYISDFSWLQESEHPQLHRIIKHPDSSFSWVQRRFKEARIELDTLPLHLPKNFFWHSLAHHQYPDGSFLLGGSLRWSRGADDFRSQAALIKIEANGQVLWQRSYFFNLPNSSVASILPREDGSIWIGGKFFLPETRAHRTFGEPEEIYTARPFVRRLNSLGQNRGDFSQQIVLYPNPVRYLLRFEAEDLQSYRIISPGGQLLQQGQSQGSDMDAGITHAVPVERLSPGLYYLVLEFRGGEQNSVSFYKRD